MGMIAQKSLQSVSAVLAAGVAACLLSAQLFAGLPAEAYAADTSLETQTLTGVIGEDITIPSTVNHVVLSNVTANADATITCAGDITLEIAAGTENTIGEFNCVGNLDVTGSGTLYAQSILTLGSYGTFNHTGTINMGPGIICAGTGDLIFNSGIIKTEYSEAYDYAILASEGSVIINGGYLDLQGEVSAIYGGTKVDLQGGTLQATSRATAAIMAGLGNEESSITVSNTMDLGGLKVGYFTSEDGEDTITVLTDASNTTLTQVSVSGPSVTDSTDYTALAAKNNEATSTNTETNSASTESSAGASSPSTLSGTTLLIGFLVVVIVGTVIAAALITRSSVKKQK